MKNIITYARLMGQITNVAAALNWLDALDAMSLECQQAMLSGEIDLAQFGLLTDAMQKIRNQCMTQSVNCGKISTSLENMEISMENAGFITQHATAILSAHEMSPEVRQAFMATLALVEHQRAGRRTVSDERIAELAAIHLRGTGPQCNINFARAVIAETADKAPDELPQQGATNAG